MCWVNAIDLAAMARMPLLFILCFYWGPVCFLEKVDGWGDWISSYRALSRVNNKHFMTNQFLSRVGNLKSEYFLMTSICSNPCQIQRPTGRVFSMSVWAGYWRSKKSGSGWGSGRVEVFERYDWIFWVNLSLGISRYFRVFKLFLGIWGIFKRLWPKDLGLCLTFIPGC